MRTFLSVPLVLVTIGLLGADDPVTGDLAKLQGKWKTMAGPNQDIPVELTITGKEVRVAFSTENGQSREIKGEIKIDDKASPKAIDWLNFKRPDGQPLEPNLAIYKLEDDDKKLTVCNGGPGNARPTEFKKSEDNRPSLLVFTRVREVK